MGENKTLERVFECARVAAEKRGTDIVVLDMRGTASFTDYFLIVSGSSDRRVQTVAEAVLDIMKRQGVRPLGVEGLKEGRWALLDFGDWVVHVFYEEVRAEYGLEDLWFDAPRVEVPAHVLEPEREVVP